MHADDSVTHGARASAGMVHQPSLICEYYVTHADPFSHYPKLHTAWQLYKENADHILNSQNAPHCSPLWVSYGVSGVFIASILEEINHLLMVCDMAFIEPMHRNKPNITYLSSKGTLCYDKLSLISLCLLLPEAASVPRGPLGPCNRPADWHTAGAVLRPGAGRSPCAAPRLTRPSPAPARQGYDRQGGAQPDHDWVCYC